MTRVRAGTSGFSYPQWRGRFYPADLADDAMLAHYAVRLGTVEINNTFYRMPKPAVLTGWADQVPDDFVFVIKGSRRITHQAKLKPPEAHDSMAYLWKMVASLGGKLGPVLLQTPHYQRKNADLLREFVAATIPPGARVALELQHTSWDDDEIDRILADAGVARVIADREDGTARAVRTAGFTYTRLRKDDYTVDELDRWLDQLGGLGGTDAYVFFKHEDTARGAELALETMARAAARGGDFV
jgi:uncharacterized protein YecE (DUF72 family)